MNYDDFWQKLKKPFTILAPMANVTDWAFRQVVIEAGRPASAKAMAGKPDVFFTEFISADGIVAVGKEKFKGELYFTENERPIVVQFFTSNPENMYKCALLAQELGFDGIDINMGCPDKSVEKQGAGAALIKNSELAQRVIKEAIRGASSTSSGQAGLPVSVKTRLGHGKVDYDWFKNLLNTDIVAITVHGRTRKEMSKVPAHWDEIGKMADIAKGSGKLIIGNGDVANMEDVRQKAKQYGLDGIMVGRGIFQNPWFFNRGNTEGKGKNGKISSRRESRRDLDSPAERIKLLKMHLDNFEKLWGHPPDGGKNFDVMKRFFKIYINGWSGAKELRTELMTTRTKEEVVAVLAKYHFK